MKKIFIVLLILGAAGISNVQAMPQWEKDIFAAAAKKQEAKKAAQEKWLHDNTLGKDIAKENAIKAAKNAALMKEIAKEIAKENAIKAAKHAALRKYLAKEIVIKKVRQADLRKYLKDENDPELVVLAKEKKQAQVAQVAQENAEKTKLSAIHLDSLLKNNQGFVASIFFQQPSESGYQMMYSTQSPTDMTDYYTSMTKLGLKLTNYANLSGASDSKSSNFFQVKENFNQYVTTGYFSTIDGDLYITQPSTPKNSINLVQLRMMTLGISDYTATAVSKLYKNSFGVLMECFQEAMTYGNPGFLLGISLLSKMDTYSQMNQFKQFKPTGKYITAMKFNVQKVFSPDWHPFSNQTQVANIIKVIPPIFSTINFASKVALNRNSFSKVSGVAMKAGTYFGDSIVFNLNLVTPGTVTSPNDSIETIMDAQKTYNLIYPLTGYSECGDNFGF